VSEDIWSEANTTPDAIEAAMRELLRIRHAANERLAPARVLNLVVIIDREWRGEIANRLERAGRYHASRTVLCSVQEGRRTLDAMASVASDEDASGGGVIHEGVEIDLGPGHLPDLQTIVDPVLIGEIPTIVWSPHGHEEAVRALLPLTDVILLDSDEPLEPAEALARADALREEVYVIDLAWLRTTPWRERLAASYDLPSRLRALRCVEAVEVGHQERSCASGLLLCGWLASRLHWDRVHLSGGLGMYSAAMSRADGEVEVSLRSFEQEAPGLVGVTVTGGDGSSLALRRGLGGLDATEQLADGAERRWKILGASRGESGILGEGVRQALLRDPTYLPALKAAREMCPI